MADITIYTTKVCPIACAPRTAQAQGAKIHRDRRRRRRHARGMIAKSGGRRSVPQIFIDGKLIGGSDDLYALDAAGKLDPLLAA
ncbi:MAG: glutaredoxin [Alphaproteobacteria bacterium]